MASSWPVAYNRAHPKIHICYEIEVIFNFENAFFLEHYSYNRIDPNFQPDLSLISNV